MFVVKYRKIWFIISAVLILLSAYVISTFGFKLSIDFKGGNITEFKYTDSRPDKSTLEGEIEKLGFGGFSVRPSEEDKFIVRTKNLTESEIEELIEVASIQGKYQPLVERSNSVGPTAGAELKSKAVKAIIVVVLMIVIFITFAFRGVSKPVASWKYGFATIIALFHDVLIPTGIFVFLGQYFGVEIDILFVTGLLAVLGYSVHDTIVVFDRVRENLRINYEKNTSEDFEATVGRSVSQTFARSINTSLTIFITLLALYIFGPSATEHFSLLLLIGVVIGTYSSIFVASPLLVTFYKFQKK